MDVVVTRGGAQTDVVNLDVVTRAPSARAAERHVLDRLLAGRKRELIEEHLAVHIVPCATGVDRNVRSARVVEGCVIGWAGSLQTRQMKANEGK